MPGLFGGGNKTQQTTQTTEYPAWISGAQQTASNAGSAMATPFLQVPKYGVAGFNPDQMKGFDLARDMAQTAFTSTPVRRPAANPATATASNASVTNATAAQVNPGDVQAAFNPFVSGVITPTLERMTREKNASAAEIGARAAASGSFGGSREAVQRALLDRSHIESVGSTVAQLMAQGHDQATATALANAQMRQQTALTNAGAANETSQFNANAANGVSQFNAGATNSYNLQAPGVEDSLASSEQQRRMNALAQLLGVGSQQQALTQTGIDLPWTTLQRLLGVTPQVYGSTQTGVAPDNSPSGFQQLLGAGVSLLGTATGGGGTLLSSLLK
ncbi:hypothetical protein [Aureimonas sp. AU20]|uniref:hypothetical protein n=1 Tax=Aureimonas sp. AU20 TaxID=1349819 RepID=UPI0007220D74|nr:hypothetical protein [Aureimonas sp. AU20]ALN73525.1 hypothetical protein M673_12435 [Aureimonas sp. AU20]